MVGTVSLTALEKETFGGVSELKFRVGETVMVATVSLTELDSETIGTIPFILTVSDLRTFDGSWVETRGMPFEVSADRETDLG